MKIVVQNQTTLHYLHADKKWASDLEEALLFENFLAAMNYCSSEGLTGVQVLIKFDDEAADLRVFPPPLKRGVRDWL